ncbi:MAG: hypothetical protein GQ475_01100 [Methylococcaceae bacterium]|nr:hypothetical protein [Methylococcaceae bacterium]
MLGGSTLSIIAGCACTSPHNLRFDIQNPSRGQTSNWEKLKGLSEFNPNKHSDGCSGGGMSDTYSKLTIFHAKHGEVLPWRSCCVTHDEAYYYGGSKIKKINADETLKECINSNQGGGGAFGVISGNIMQGAVTPGAGQSGLKVLENIF